MKNALTIIVIAGQTATGKSDLAVQLARIYNGEVISADSRQVYRDLDLGSGKITQAEMEGIPHHLLDVCDVQHVYTVAEYCVAARACIADIFARGKTPIICGGTGLYIDALLNNFDFDNTPANAEVRSMLEARSLEDNVSDLVSRNPERAATIDLNNQRRVVRALEKEYSALSIPTTTNTETSPNNDISLPAHRTIYIALKREPDAIRAAIAKRLLVRLDAGMVAEVQGLLDAGCSHERLEQLGLEYRYISRYLRGELEYQALIDELVLRIRQYAKRQLTWFKRSPKYFWILPDDTSPLQAATAYIDQFDSSTA